VSAELGAQKAGVEFFSLLMLGVRLNSEPATGGAPTRARDTDYMKIPFTVGCVLPLTLAACSLYAPQPVDIRRDTAEWKQVSAKLCEDVPAMNLQRLHEIGLLLNPELNKARMAVVRSTASAEFAGLWDDPELSADLKQVREADITNRGIGLSLTLPVTGLPGLARKVAECYKEVDYLNMVSLEREYLVKLDVLRYQVLAAHARQELMAARVKQMAEEQKSAQRMHELGEMEFADFQVICRRLNDGQKELQEMEQEHLELHLELVRLLGLHPDTRHVEVEGQLPKSIPAAVPTPSYDMLRQHPAVLAAMAAHRTSEAELEREIRKQYPELSVNSGFEHEDGNSKVGIGIGVNLPLWNRNQQGIAQAYGERDIKEYEALQTWRHLQQQAVSLSDMQALLLKHCRAEQERVAQLSDAEKKQEKLYAIGETKLPAVADARQEAYLRRLNYLECLTKLLTTQVELQYLNPDFIAK
jgi:outer membrane protein TolC